MAKARVAAPRKTARTKKSVVATAARRRRPVPKAAARKARAPRSRTVQAIGPVRKPTITTLQAFSRLQSLLAKFPALYSIWSKPDPAAAFREELMVAVARQNDAPYCNWMHRSWAELEGASPIELAKIEHLDSRGLDRRKWAAVAYVRALASSDFKDVPLALRRDLEARYSAAEIKDIELVAETMDLINRMANTYDAMLARLQRKPNPGSSVVDELVFSGAFVAIAPLMILLLSRLSGRPYAATTRSLVKYVQRFPAEKASGRQA